MNAPTILDWVKNICGQPEKLWLTACAALLIPLSILIMICFLFSSDFLGMGERSPKAMMEGTAMKPHVYRQLIPLMARGVIDLTPADMEQAMPEVLHNTLWNNGLFKHAVLARHGFTIPPELHDENLYPLVIITIINYFFLLGYAYMLWRLAKQLMPEFFSVQILAPLIGLLALPPFCGKFGYIYDFPVLFFSAWLALLLCQNKLWLFDTVIGLATFNKETSIYMIALFFVFSYRRLPKETVALHIAVQAFAFLVVKLGLGIYFSDNPGTMLEYRGFITHLHMALEGYSVYTLLGLGAALALFSYRWHEKPAILRCWMCLLPVITLAWLFFGNRTEYRVFYEIFPCLSLLAAHTFATALHWDKDEGNPYGFQDS